MPQGLIKFIVANHITYKLQFLKRKFKVVNGFTKINSFNKIVVSTEMNNFSEKGINCCHCLFSEECQS